ncbi:MAG TPA: glutathione S-transferase family protein [Oligoflexus sp.]|uniref:glutathione S-transferase family protein n=1 Tax=Oligoflexus sp. TaxID=1971216 RepID=UPI002D61089B|nr:glutathione S-transferase family protein [Oligoflexus sp.]HYX31637.1 glutathione S-transferase family protein [Oligoflexus sp.]
MLKVYGNPNTRTMRVLWLLEELQVPSELQPVDLRKGEHHHPDYWRINPFGKVPCIAIESFSLAETSAICTWLADQHRERELIPAAGSRARGTHDQWLSFALTELEAPLWLVLKNTKLLPEVQRVPAIIPQALDDFARSCRIFAAHMQARPFVLGDNFQVVDIFMTSLVSWAQSLDAPGLDKGLVEYRDRMTQRPGFQRFREKYLEPAL